jgi:Flp pilus assembly protein TadG
MIRLRNLPRDRSGAAALEFALIVGVFLPLCLGILEAGLLLWTQGALQSTASLTARCAAIASPNCSAVPGAFNVPGVQQFAVTTAGNWVFPGIIANTTANFTPAPATVCLSSVSYMKVTITSTFWAGGVLPPPLSGLKLTSVAYFPVGAC